jgi:hypothetical protein
VPSLSEAVALMVTDAGAVNVALFAGEVMATDGGLFPPVQVPNNVHASCQCAPVPGAYAQAEPLHQPEFG